MDTSNIKALFMKYNIVIRQYAMRMVAKYGIVQTAKRLEISRSTLWRWKKNGVDAKKRTYQSKKIDMMHDTCVKYIKDHPCCSAMDLKIYVYKCLKLSVSTKLIYTFLKRMNMSYKRVKYRGVSKRFDPEYVAMFKTQYKEAMKNGKTFVSIDECGFSGRTRALHGWSPKGKPIIVHQPGSWKNYSLLMAVYSSGLVKYFIFDKAVNGECFDAFVKTLQLNEDHVILLDNASIHSSLKKNPGQTNALYTPVYQPEFNPIELCFGIAKQGQETRMAYSRQ